MRLVFNDRDRTNDLLKPNSLSVVITIMKLEQGWLAEIRRDRGSRSFPVDDVAVPFLVGSGDRGTWTGGSLLH